MTNTYRHIIDFALAEFDIEPLAPGNEVSQRVTCGAASHRLYRNTDRGLGLAPLGVDGQFLKETDPEHATVYGVAINGIVEGTEIESSLKLMFPFTSEQFWAAVESLNAELADAEADWEAQGDDQEADD